MLSFSETRGKQIYKDKNKPSVMCPFIFPFGLIFVSFDIILMNMKQVYCIYGKF